MNGSCFDERCHDKDSTFLTRLGETDVLENIAKISALYMFKFIYMYLRLYLSNVIFNYQMTFSSSVFVKSGWNLCLISLHTVEIFSVAPSLLINLCWDDESLTRRMSKSGMSVFPSEKPSVLDSLTFSLSVTTSVSEKEEGCQCLQSNNHFSFGF